MRTPSELFAELDAAVKPGMFNPGIVVVRADGRFVSVKMRNPNRVEKLAALIEKGGDPIGIAAVVERADGTPVIRTREFADHGKKAWARSLLSDLAGADEDAYWGNSSAVMDEATWQVYSDIDIDADD